MMKGGCVYPRCAAWEMQAVAAERVDAPTATDSLTITEGGVAQLVERLNGIQEVRSSILLTSTLRKRFSS